MFIWFITVAVFKDQGAADGTENERLIPNFFSPY